MRHRERGAVRVLLDTNVWVAALVARGACHELVEHCQRSHTLVVSTFILDELERTLAGKFSVPSDRAVEARGLLEGWAERVDPSSLPEAVCRDPDDDHIIAAAVSGRCDCLITGDSDLLTLEEHDGIPILAPRDFWEFEAQRPETGDQS